MTLESTASTLASFPAAPADAIGPDGKPRFGAYRGGFTRVDMSAVASGWKLLTRRKRWQWGTVLTDEVLVSFAIVDAGYASSAFAFVVDRASGKLLADRSFLGGSGGATVNDRPGDGARSTFKGGGCAMEFSRVAGKSAFEVSIEARGLSVECELESRGGPPPLAIVMPVGPDRVDCTQKTVLLATQGSITVHGNTRSLDGGLGGLDYTHGLLPRDTSWRWAFALGRATDGTPVALNLSDGLSSEVREDALWIGDAFVPLGAARFDFDPAHPDREWHVTTSDGAVDLRFTVQDGHREFRNLVLLKSHFVQLAGNYRGTLRAPDGRTLQIERLAGFAEDQRVRW